DGAQQPVAPVQCRLGAVVQQQGFQGEGGVTQPAVAVVPVADTSGSSGREVVGAATMPPVSAWVRARSTSRERRTVSAHGPCTLTRSLQSFPSARVRSRGSRP